MSTSEKEAEAPREVVVGKMRLRDSQFGVQAFIRTHPAGGYWTTANPTQIATFREVARLQDALVTAERERDQAVRIALRSLRSDLLSLSEPSANRDYRNGFEAGVRKVRQMIENRTPEPS